MKTPDKTGAGTGSITCKEIIDVIESSDNPIGLKELKALVDFHAYADYYRMRMAIHHLMTHAIVSAQEEATDALMYGLGDDDRPLMFPLEWLLSFFDKVQLASEPELKIPLED